MRQLLTALITLFLLALPAAAQEALPFPVTVGGQNAVMTDKSSVISFIEQPVSSSAVLAVKNVEGQIIVNIFPSDEKGEVANGVQPMILLFDASTGKAISDNIGGTTPKAGWYATNVVGGGKTSRVCFQVK